MKVAVEVAVGLLVRQGRVWVQTREGAAHLAGFQEFPGGKLEPGEGPLEALLREIREETGLALSPSAPRFLFTVRHRYPDREVTLHFFVCRVDPFEPTGLGEWLRIEDLGEENFPPANREALAWLASHRAEEP